MLRQQQAGKLKIDLPKVEEMISGQKSMMLSKID